MVQQTTFNYDKVKSRNGNKFRRFLDSGISRNDISLHKTHKLIDVATFTSLNSRRSDT